ncbi:anti-sigma factor [Occultella kanbiaonis]|uniref:anti-sigma factor n=1 Tax=Occultella kanbiaonis TaxID=2675754 RepID=UPI0012B89555|nr:anti-sigma factor [Occultella kanbiaonis]
MAHLDDETLALLALGEQAGGTGAREHLAECSRCQGELAAFERVTRAGRNASDPDELDVPAARVWERVALELGLPEPGPAQATAEAAEPTVKPASHRWRRRTAWIVAASFVAGVGVSVAVDRLLEPAPPTARTIATADLEALPGWQDGGTAALREVDGQQVLSVEVTGDGSDGFREVWLIDVELQRLISLGILVGESGEFAVPAGVDVAEFPIVDVSDEPFDGDPAHSGDSIVRGELT